MHFFSAIRSFIFLNIFFVSGALLAFDLGATGRCLAAIANASKDTKGYDRTRVTELSQAHPYKEYTNGSYMYGNIPDLPLQGWKLHVSFPRDYPFQVVESLTPFLLEEFPSLPFKVPDAELFRDHYGNEQNRQYGKLLTIYPRSAVEAKEVIKKLEPILNEMQNKFGTFVPAAAGGEIPMGPPGLFGRYGRFTSVYGVGDNKLVRVNKAGQALGSDGEIIVDNGIPITLDQINVNEYKANGTNILEATRLFLILGRKGAIVEDDRSQIPTWARELVELSP